MAANIKRCRTLGLFRNKFGMEPINQNIILDTNLTPFEKSEKIWTAMYKSAGRELPSLFNKNLEDTQMQNSIEDRKNTKDIVRRALGSYENYNLLLCAPPASAKTLFMLSIIDMRKDGVYFDGSNTTNSILDVLEEERPKIICIDELDKMPRQFQNQLLNFMESGRVKVDQQKKQYDFEIKGAGVDGWG